MIRSSSVLRDASAAAAVAVLALTVGLSAAPPAMADDGDTPPVLCLLNCPTEGTQPDEPGQEPLLLPLTAYLAAYLTAYLAA